MHASFFMCSLPHTHTAAKTRLRMALEALLADGTENKTDPELKDALEELLELDGTTYPTEATEENNQVCVCVRTGVVCL